MGNTGRTNGRGRGGDGSRGGGKAGVGTCIVSPSGWTKSQSLNGYFSSGQLSRHAPLAAMEKRPQAGDRAQPGDVRRPRRHPLPRRARFHVPAHLSPLGGAAAAAAAGRAPGQQEHEQGPHRGHGAPPPPQTKKHSGLIRNLEFVKKRET